MTQLENRLCPHCNDWFVKARGDLRCTHWCPVTQDWVDPEPVPTLPEEERHLQRLAEHATAMHRLHQARHHLAAAWRASHASRALAWLRHR